MAATPRNLLIANGQELIAPLSWPPRGGPKMPP